jgi:hypothetical protein
MGCRARLSSARHGSRPTPTAAPASDRGRDPAARAARPAGLRTDLSASGLPGSRASSSLGPRGADGRAGGPAVRASRCHPRGITTTTFSPSPTTGQFTTLQRRAARMSNYNALHQTRGSSEWQTVLGMAIRFTTNCGKAYTRVGDKARRLCSTPRLSPASQCATGRSPAGSSASLSMSSSARLGSNTEVLWEKTCSYSNLAELRVRVNQLANVAQLL